MLEGYNLGFVFFNNVVDLETNLNFFLTSTARGLVWQEWEDIYTVYQPSSCETHVFNDITAAILQTLEKDALAIAEIADRVAKHLGFGIDELSCKDLSFAIRRLEELGLVECSNRTNVT